MYLLIGATLAFIIASFWARWFQQYSWAFKLPGPGLLGCIFPFPFGPLTGGNSVFLKTAVKEFGDIFVYWFNWKPLVIISTADQIKEFYKNSNGHSKSGDAPYFIGEPFNEMLGECLGVIFGEKYRQVRPYFSRAMTHDKAIKFLPEMKRITLEWIDNMNSAEDDFISIRIPDVNVATYSLTFQMMCEVLFGKLSDEDWKELAELNELSQIQMETAAFHTWSKFIPFYNHLPIRRNVLRMQFTYRWEKFLQRQENTLSSGGTVYSEFLKVVQDGHLSRKAFNQTMDEIVFANRDVFGPVVSWTLIHIAASSTLQGKLRKEISQFSEQELLWSDRLNSKDLSLLASTMMESARVQPITGLTYPERIESPIFLKSTTHGELAIPAKAFISTNISALHLNKDMFKNAEDFQADRFQHKKDGEIRYSYNRFGMGARKCLGQYFANAFLKTVVITLLEKFDLEIGSEVAERDLQHTLKDNSLLSETTPFLTADRIPIILRRRLNNE
jgi:cytochrome P450